MDAQGVYEELLACVQTRSLFTDTELWAYLNVGRTFYPVNTRPPHSGSQRTHALRLDVILGAIVLFPDEVLRAIVARVNGFKILGRAMARASLFGAANSPGLPLDVVHVDPVKTKRLQEKFAEASGTPKACKVWDLGFDDRCFPVASALNTGKQRVCTS